MSWCLVLLVWVVGSPLLAIWIGRMIRFRDLENLPEELDTSREYVGNVFAVTRFAVLPSVCATVRHADETWAISGKPNQSR